MSPVFRLPTSALGMLAALVAGLLLGAWLASAQSPLLEPLLAAAGTTGPYVLVSFGSGGPMAQLYADWYPAEVAGLVLVNAPLYGQSQLIGQILPPGPREQYLEAVRQAVVRRIGA